MAELLLFTALTPTAGWELWASDGTAGGTSLLADIAPGSVSGDPYGLVADGDRAWFFAQSDDRFELWETDGTPAGTKIADSLAGTDGFGGDGLIAVGDTLYFTATDETHGAEPWVFRPGQGAAGMLVDLLPGPDGSSPMPVGRIGDDAVIAATAADGVRALWRIGDTVERLTAVGVDVAGAPGAMLDGWLYFTATDADHGAELWRTDGTVDGTALVADIIAGATGSEPGPPTVLGEAILFAAGAPGDMELWRFDGTTASRVADILLGAVGSEPAGFAVLDGIAYFSAADVRGRELWRSDGTADGTRLVADIKETGSSEPEDLVVLDGRLFFNADDGIHGRELWVSDGTPEGTGMLVDINPAGTGLPRGMVVIEAAAPAADTIPPDSWVQSGPPVDTDSTTATFVFSSNEDGVRFETALDGGQWQAAGASATFTELAPGDHVLLVRAIDVAGNADPTPAIYPWSIGGPSPDTIPPDTAIQSGPSVSGDAGRDATFVFGSDEDQAAFEVSLDGGPYMTVLNPLVMRDLATGQHALLVRAVDPAGNVDPTPAAYSWTVGADSGGPGAVIRTGPAASSTAAVAIFDLEDAPAGRSFEGRLDGGAWQPAGDPVALFGLTAGPHRYEVRMVGTGADPTPAAWTWTIAPEPAVTDPGPAPVAGGKILVVQHFTDLLDPAIGDDVGWIQTRDSIRMPDGVANLTLLGADELNADGNDRANLMLGNAAANILLGQGGRDAIHGGGGGDFLAGGLGDDTILGDEDAEGASGDDTIWGGQGNDSILGGAGRDALNGDLGADTLLGGADADTLNGGTGDDRLDAGSGADLLRGGRGDDLLLGGAGADTLAGDLGSDTLWGGEGADQFLTMTAAADPGAVDVVADFTVGVDRLWIDAASGIIDEATFRARAHDGGEMTLLELGQNGWVVLLGVRPDEIGLGDLLIL